MPMVLPPPGLDVDAVEFILRPVNTVLVQVGVPTTVQLQYPPPVFCQEVVNAAAAFNAGSSLRGAPRSSTSAAGPPSSKLKTDRRNVTMCSNLTNCRFGKDCHFAHSREELKRFTKEELTQANKSYLSTVCFDHTMLGTCPFNDNCSSLHDPNVSSREGIQCGKCFVRGTSSVKPHQVYRLRHRFLNSITQTNVLIQDDLWKMRANPGDLFEFEDTCNFIANSPELNTSGMFKLPFHIPNGTEKLSIKQKMAIALLMHKKSPFSEDSSHEAYLDYTFSARSGIFIGGQTSVILQIRHFKVDSESCTVEEVPLQSSTTDVVKAYEVVFGAKGSSDPKNGSPCKHSLWFDATIVKSRDEAAKHVVNSVHTKPYVFMEPIDDAKEGHELIHSIMEEMIGSNGGPLSTELRERFIQLNNFNRALAWPETQPPSAEEAATLKTMEEHVNSPYNCKGGKVEAIWKSFKANLGVVCDNKAPEGGSRLSAFRHNKAGRRSVFSTLPEFPKNSENMADFLADYSQ